MDHLQWDWQQTLQSKIKEILDKYPDDGQILKEIIQNAEDGKAKCVKFLYDKKSYSTDGLQDPSFAQHQGEALYAYNDAVFTDEDFKNLLNVGKSYKQADRTKVGRFGQGFKSIFHMTELPTLLSGKYIAKISPYKETLPCGAHSRVYSEFPAELLSFQGEFQGYDEGVDKDGLYKGTMFRFPLRKQESEISKTLYGEEKIMDLFNSLKDRAYMNLLFLKSLESIEVYVREKHETNPRLQFRICLKTRDEEVLCRRANFFQELGVAENKLVDDQRHLTYQIDLETYIPGRAGDAASGCADDIRSFLVCHFYDAKCVSPRMKKLLGDEQLSYLPLVGVAMPLGVKHAHGIPQPDGHIFCFLPLPIHDNKSPTGLPVHINSFFVVSSDRSEVKWPTAGQSHEKMSNSLKWNQCLLEELIPCAYTQLLLDATRQSQIQPDDVCHAFADTDLVDEKLKDTLLLPFLKQVLRLSILPAAEAANTYVSVENAVLCSPQIDEMTRLVLVRLLTESQMNAVCIPAHMMKAIKSTYPEPVKEATPSLVCQVMKQSNGYKSYSREEKLQLLEYLLVKDAVRPQDLHGLQLLPCSDGTFAVIGSSAVAEKIYIATEKNQKLLPTLGNRFLSNDVNQTLKAILCQQDMIANTQLVQGTEDDILALFPQIFPQECKGKDVLVCHKDAKHLTNTWLEDLWHFLVSVSDSHPNHLSQVKHLHILPIPSTAGELHLSKLSDGAICVVTQLHDESLPNHLAEALGHFSITLLDQLPEFIKRHPHVFDQHCVYQPNPESVLLALLAACSRDRASTVGNFNNHASREQRLAFLQFFEPLRSEQKVGSEWKSFMKQLELFETVDGSGHRPRHFMSVAGVQNGVTSYNIPVHSPCQLLDISSVDAQLISKYIGINTVTETKVLEAYFFDEIAQRRIGGADVEKVMVYILQNLDMHVKCSSTFQSRLAQLAFLTDKQGSYRRALDCFDPSDNVLQNLFQGEDWFPTKTYCSYIDQLRRIGLKSRNGLVDQELLTSAQIVDRDRGSGGMPSAQLESKSRGIADVIKNGITLSEGVRQQLQKLAWVPVQQERPTYPCLLPWGAGSDLFQTPNLLCLSSQISVVGSTMPSVRTSVVPDIILEIVRGQCNLPVAKIVQHLKNIVTVYKPEEKLVLVGFVKHVYDILKNYSAAVVKAAFIAEGLTEWVWHGNGFTLAECVSKNLPENMEPYAYRIPDEMHDIHPWLLTLGVREQCDWPQMLLRIKKWHDAQDVVSKERVSHDLEIVRLALKRITDLYPFGVPDNVKEILVLPVGNSDEQLQLLRASECTYCADEWGFADILDVPDGGIDSRNTVNYIHESIPKELAEAFGVKTSLNRLFEDDSEGIPVVEGHGQEEKLTHRLRLLLQDYPDGLAIPKELVQNADDAGACEVKLLYDERENTDAMDGLLDERMKECQGPALWIYNNKMFSAEDLENIKKLSGATKEAKADKIGKFGLGFNVVYNVTDVPSFMTNESIVIFDPHKSHLGRAKGKNDAGLKINIFSGSSRKSAQIRRKFYNQFRTYHGVFGCQVAKEGAQGPFNGTLFRLPLRKSGSKSEINSTPYTKESIKELFQLIIDQASSLLLFTQSVKSLELHHLAKTATDPSQSVQIFQMKSTPGVLRPLPCVLRSGEPTLLKTASALVKDSDIALPNEMSRTSIVSTCQQFDAGCELELRGPTNEVHWFVHDCIGTRKSMMLARSSTLQSNVPVAGVAVQLEKKDGKFQPVPNSGGSLPIFCHLPLPSSVKSGLPVIVNGSFAIKPDRRQIVKITSDDKVDNKMSAWNEALKKDAITEAYIGALTQIKEHVTKDYEPYSLWPNISSIDEGFKSVYLSFFEMLANPTSPTSPKIFTNGSSWFDYQHAAFLDETLASSDLHDVFLGRLQLYLDQTSSPNRLVVTILPNHLKEGFSIFDIQAKVFTCAEVYDKAIFPYLHQLDSPEQTRLLLFALQQAKWDQKLSNMLKEYPCIPVQPDGKQFLKPSQLISPNGRRANLFSAEDRVFPMKCLCGDECLIALRCLGMNVDAISWDLVTERAESITHLSGAPRNERMQHWASYVEEKLQSYGGGKPSQAQLEKLKSIRFLPVLPRPELYPIEWKGDDMTGGLVPATDAYPADCKNLVGSIRYIVDEKRFGLRGARSKEKVIKILGLQERVVSLDDLIIQLKMLATVQPTGPNSSKVRDICNEVYSKLDEHCRNSAEAAKVYTELKGLQCLYTGVKFMHPHHCAKNGKHVSDFLHVVTYPISYKSALLQTLGVKEQFHATDYIDALKRIAPDTRVRTVRDIAESLHDWLSKNKTTLDELKLKPDEGVRLPSEVNDRGEWKLLPVNDLCLNALDNDREKLTHKQWLGQSVGKQKLHYLHPDIPLKVAQAPLGVKSDRENVLSKLGSGMPFGQSEPLSRRIKNILDNYPSDEGVLKELLQNADDAGATELRFILDKRQHPEEKVFHDNWKQLQGPALCIYNNKPFTEKDLKGICSLGQGAKSSDPAKTGQYGIGFNSVYHLTDVPSFLTDGDEIGRTFGIFDPNLTFAPGACVEAPGQLYQGDHFKTVRDDFADVFSGYLEDKFDLKGGTLFRLPLRTKKMAEKSEITRKPVEVDEAECLLKSFEAELFQSLLFVNSVRSITLESIDVLGSRYMYSVTATTSDQNQDALHDFNQYVKGVGEGLIGGSLPLQDVQYREVIYTLSMQDSRGKAQEWAVCQCIGFKQSKIPPEVMKAVTSKYLALLPRGGAAILLNSTEEVEGRKLFCFLPLPSREDTKLPIHANGHFVLDAGRRGLWDTDKKFKALWNTLIMEKIVAQAYVSLISDQCAKLKDAGATMEDLKKLYKMFPDRSKVKKHHVLELVDEFYRALHERKIECLAVQVISGGAVKTRWFNIAQCMQGEAFFDDLSPAYVFRPAPYNYTSTYRGFGWTGAKQTEPALVKERDELHSLTNILCRLGFNLLCAPMYIYSSLQKVEIGGCKVEPLTVLNYLYNYKNYTDCTLKQIPQPLDQSPYQDIKSVVTVIKYCYKKHELVSNENIKSLKGLPLCVTDDGLLSEFSATSTRFYPRFFTLAPDHADRFVTLDVVDAVPSKVRTKEPLALVELTIQALTPLLLPAKQHLKVANKIEWKPTTDTDKPLKRWIEELWELINSEVDEACRKMGDREALLKQRLATLKPFCIIPAYDGHERKHFLYQLEYAKCVMSESVRVGVRYTDINSLVHKKLLEAGIPSLDEFHLPGRQSSPLYSKSLLALPKELTSNTDDPRSVLYALWSRLQNEPDARRLKQVTENTSNAHRLREYFTVFFKNKCTTEEADHLRDLPIYQLVNDSVTALNRGCQGCYLVPHGIPKAGLDNWYSKDTHEKFLFQTSTDVDQLLCRLGAVSMSAVDLYVTLILTEFNFQRFLSEDEQIEHLDFIRITVIPQLDIASNNYKALLASLQNLPFLKDSNGSWQLAKEFFSPSVPLFEAMETKFPPEKFCNAERLAFLQLCGLRATVTAEDLVRYAEVVEQESKTNPTDITEIRSQLICNELKNQKETTLFQLKDIAFIPIGRVPSKFSNLHCQLHLDDPEKIIYTCFQNSVMYSHFEVCWTSAKILPALLGPTLTTPNLQQSLGIRREVTMAIVVNHCIKLTRHLSRLNLRHEQPVCITDVMNQIYEYLCKKVRTEGPRDLKSLTIEPCVWLNACNSLVHPRQVVMTLSAYEAIPPYLYGLPEELWQYMEVLKHTGVEKEPDHRNYMLVLKMIKDDVGDHDLESDVNKMLAATIAISRSLYFLSKDKPDNCDYPLYLLSQKKTLEISTDLYQVDKPGWERRLQNNNSSYQLLLIPDDPRDGRTFWQNLRKIPKALRPKNLSEVVVEVIDENSMQPMVLLDNSTSSWFQDRIANEEFQAGLTQLLTFDALEQGYGDSYDEYWLQLENNMRRIQFIVVERVATILKERDGGIIPGTDSDSQNVLVKTSGAGCMVYVARDRIGLGHTSARDVREYTKLLKSIIKESFPTLLKGTLDIIKDLFNTPHDEIQALLDDNGIRASSRIRSKMGPTLGDYVPLHKHCLLAPDFLQFFTGEFIAFELDDPLNNGLDGQATYIYAKVVKALVPEESADEDQVISMYEIDTGNVKITTSSCSMYKLSCHALTTADNVPTDQEYDLEKVKRQVASDLDYAYYKLTIEDRNLVLKRLVMKWQPENHPGHEDTANEILKFIDSRIEKIETDTSRPESNGGSGGTRWYGVEHISRYACSRAQEQRQHIQQQRQWLDSNSSARSGLSDPTDYSYFRRGLCRNPQPGEAKRWYRQASMDLQASKYDHDGSNSAYEWALYKCHQAAEKALKSAYFMKDVVHSMSHNLPEIAALLRDQTLQGLADEIAQELGDGMKLRYPDRLSFPQIPHDLYNEETCARIYGLTERLLQRVGHFVQ